MMSVQFVHGDEEDRQLGHEAAKNLKHLARVSFAVCATFRQHSGADIARQSGLDLQIFDSLPEASEWISARSDFDRCEPLPRRSVAQPSARLNHAVD
jgi:hypothetical protein